MIDYHDREWGVPLHDDRQLFELLNLEGAQAGLSWATILKKREGYREAFHDFDPRVVAAYSDVDLERLLTSASIVRNRLKVNAVVTNARAFLLLVDELGSFDRYLWDFVSDSPLTPVRPPGEFLPATTPESQRLSVDLRKRGFKFVGPTICYAFMQSAGLVNDHLVTCFRHDELAG